MVKYLDYCLFLVLFSSFLYLQESKAILTQAKHTRTASAHLGPHIDSALQKLSEQEMLTDVLSSKITPEVPNKDTVESLHFDQYSQHAASKSIFSCFQPDVTLTSVKEDMEAAKLQLKAYSVALTELISKIGKSLGNTLF